MIKTTVVIPSYKSERTIREAVSSVVNSNDVDATIIVVEDGLFDGTKAALREFRGKISHIEFQNNQGAQRARNHGLSMVETDTVMFLDADDYLRPDFLKGLIVALSESEAGLAFGAMELFFEDSGKTHLFIPPEGQSRHEIAERWLRGSPGPHPCGVLWKTDVVRRIGGWHERMHRNQDGEIVLRAIKMGHEVTISKESSAVCRQHNGERVSSNPSWDAFECQTIVLELMKEWNAEDDCFDFSLAIAEFCMYTAYHAYKAGHHTIGKEWEDKAATFTNTNSLIWHGPTRKRLKYGLIKTIGMQNLANLSRYRGGCKRNRANTDKSSLM
jgi:glycosyltransferase involved in cell wall biosynthesis